MINIEEQIVYSEKKTWKNYYSRQFTYLFVFISIGIPQAVILIASINNTIINIIYLMLLFLVLVGLDILWYYNVRTDFLKFLSLKITNKYIYLPQLDDNKQLKRIEWSEITQLYLMNFNSQFKGIFILRNTNRYDIIKNEYLGDIEIIKNIIQKLSQKKFEHMNDEKYASVVRAIFISIDEHQKESDHE